MWDAWNRNRVLRPSLPLESPLWMFKTPTPQFQQEILGDGNCTIHKEPLQLFCTEDQTVLCFTCFQCQDHSMHVVCEIRLAANNYRNLFQGILKTLKEQLEVAKIMLADEHERVMLIQEEEQNFSEMIQSENRILFQLITKINEKSLQNNEGNLSWRELGQNLLSHFAKEVENSQETIKRLKNLSRENIMKLQESEVKLSERISNLQMISAELERKCGESAFTLLQNARYYLTRGESLLHQCLESACITELSLCHVSGMSHILKHFQRPITLDPNTAHPCLVLSEDMRSMRLRAARQILPQNSRKFDFSARVLSVERFTSGWHYWEVEVEKATSWQLGICFSSDKKRDRSKAFECKVLLTRFMMEKDCTCWVFPPLKRVSLRDDMCRVGLFLYYEYGQLSFYDVTEGCLIYNFSNLIFWGAVRPHFSLCVPNGDSLPDSLSICLPSASADNVLAI
ncbi:probable E3 ubiquitin-protein ligase TRIML2 [Suncus etruscus]|uniref:probable E3 ubiquitin-protein ligase TRIML2 n=1 Tax=Suncus etruscus TaxID=109475 RepID=UPI00210F5386|nr:probable E3 ubiquitin-protein ligase TRIML2 [Suncus etruscus]